MTKSIDAALAAYQSGDYYIALLEWRSLAEQCDASAQFNLGIMYANGHGVMRDNAEAARLFRLAAEQRHAGASFNLGVMYANGRGVTQDYMEAARWFHIAANQGNASAQLALGVMYANGQGLTRDDAQAVRWYRMAAQQGDADAQFNLGLMYKNLDLSKTPKIVAIGDRVRVQKLDGSDDEIEITLSGNDYNKPESGFIGRLSPFSAAVVGAEVGDVVEYRVGKDIRTVRIVKILDETSEKSGLYSNIANNALADNELSDEKGGDEALLPGGEKTPETSVQKSTSPTSEGVQTVPKRVGSILNFDNEGGRTVFLAFVVVVLVALVLATVLK